MQRLIIFGAVWALAVARPELYKEKEDFQFSRSSSDDGSKSGFYGAQRGNMGGNYERAHNMDSLAQNQMSGLVRQVEGELGDGAKTRTGSVYSAANSRGTYGSGHYDLSNLAGRNFQEGNSYGDSQSQSSNSASAYNAAYANSRSQSSRHNGYQATGYSGLNLQSDDLQALDHTQGASQYDYGRQSSHAAGYNAQSGYQQHASYDTSNTNSHSGGYGSNVNTRLISATPVRIIVRPGTRVAIPIAAQSYDLTHGSSSIDQNSLNSEAEVLSNDNQRTAYRPGNAKHYESSYNYRKEWEKHDTYPAPPATTDNPFPRNSELYEDRQARTGSDQYDTRRVDSQRAQSTYGGYNANVKSTSGQSRVNYDTQRHGASHTNANAYSYGTNHQESSSDSSSNGYQSQYNAGRYHGATADSLTQAAHSANAAADLNSQVENLNTKPKSYQSAYSYHKSWERQGDPYVIKPASSGYYDGQSSQKLTTGSQHHHSHQSEVDCDENGHIRVARSSNTDKYEETQQQSQNLEDFGQQQQSQNLEDFGQQQQSQNLEDFGQQQQSQNLEDFGQQSQNLDDFGQQQQSQNLEDFGQQQQQSQNLEDFGQQQQSQNLEDLGQQQQRTNLADFGQEQYKQNLEDFHQQVDNAGQQTRVLWDQEEAGQQAQNTWDNLEQLSQQSHKMWDDRERAWDKFEDLVHQPQDVNKQTNVEQNNQNDLGQHTQDTKLKLNNNSQDQQPQDNSYMSQDEQQNGKTHDQSNNFNQQETQLQQNNDSFNFLQQTQKHNNNQMSVWDKFDFESNQNVRQNKFDSEHTNSNDNWSFVSQQTGQDQQPLNSGSNSDQSQSVHNVNKSSTSDQITNTQQVYKIPDTNEQSNTGYFNLHTDQNQFSKNENSFLETHKLHEGSNWYFSNSHRQEQTTNTESYSHAFETNSPNTAPLSSLWNKLGNIEKTSLTHNVDQGNIVSQVHTSTQNSYGNSMHAYHDKESTSQEHLNSQIKPYHDLIPHNEDKDINQDKSNDTKMEKESSLDVGRGDIGPEELSDLKPDKHPSDTPVSSETIQNRDEKRTNNTNTQHGQNNFDQNEQTNLQNFGKQDKLEQQNLQDFGLQVNVEQQNYGRHDKFEQQSSQQFGQQENLEQQSLQDFGQQVTEEQQNLQEFGQHANVEQQNLQDFGQHTNVEQQNLQEFGQQANVDQQNLQDFGQQGNEEQQNLQNFGQHDNVEQQNLQDFGQQANVDQINLQDFGQHANVEQQNLQDFGQQANVDQQNLQDFGQQANVEQQNLQDFGQQANVEQQNLQDFGKQDNLEQQNLHDFGQQVNLDHFRSRDNSQQKNENLEQLSQNSEHLKYPKEERTTVPKNNEQSQNNFSPSEVTEKPIVKKQNNDLHSISAQTPVTEISSIEPVTESTGFWKSVGNKFSSAKSKIASWF